MKNSVNAVHLSGHLGKDPESKYLPSGTMQAKVSMAVNKTWKTENGEERKQTSWIPLVFWGKTAEKFVMPYLHKGDEIYVEGSLSIREWTNEEGVKKYFTEVSVTDVRIIKSKNDAGAASETVHNDSDQQTDNEAPPEDDIPF
jgi:single-strand DNA-binding protein